MINTILLKTQLVVDSSLWEVPLMCLLVIFAFAVIYFIYFRITYNMAKKRHRDPLGWILLSFLISPIWVWIILLIVGEASKE